MQITEPNRFIECVIAPGYQRRGLRAADHPADAGRRASACCAPGRSTPAPAGSLDFRRVDGGLLVQTRDVAADDFADAEGGHEAAADRRGAGRPALRLAGRASTSRATPSCWPRAAWWSASARGR